MPLKESNAQRGLATCAHLIASNIREYKRTRLAGAHEFNLF